MTIDPPTSPPIGKMNPKASVIATLIVLLLTSLETHPSLAQTPKKFEFYCGRTNDIYPATMLAARGSEPRTIVVWRNKFGKMSPQQRCETISRRFQAALDRGNLNFLIPGIDRQTGHGLICAVKSGENQCDTKQMLFALRNQQDAQEILRGLYDSIRRTGNPIYQSSSSESIDIKELIDSLANPRF
jgi:Circadian oscillating protein COP23